MYVKQDLPPCCHQPINNKCALRKFMGSLNNELGMSFSNYLILQKFPKARCHIHYFLIKQELVLHKLVPVCTKAIKWCVIKTCVQK